MTTQSKFETMVAKVEASYADEEMPSLLAATSTGPGQDKAEPGKMARPRYVRELDEEVATPDVDVFLEEIATVCARHGMTISHEDYHGGFVIEALDDHNLRWLADAVDARTLGRKL